MLVKMQNSKCTTLLNFKLRGVQQDYQTNMMSPAQVAVNGVVYIKKTFKLYAVLVEQCYTFRWKLMCQFLIHG